MTAVAVLGASGVYGRHLLPRLAEAGFGVRALVRRAEAAAALAACGIDTAVADILAPATLAPALAGCATVVNVATAVPRPGTAPDFARNDRIRRAGTANLVAACREAGVARLVQQSIAMLWAAGGAAWVDEETPIAGAGAAASAAEMEETVRASGLDWCILRGGAFYGPGTGREERWRAEAAAGTLALPANAGDYVSPIHVADMAAATVAALAGWRPNALYAVVDDEPVAWEALLGHVARQAGAPPPRPGPTRATASFRVSNARIKAALGWRPFYASYRSGLA